MTELLSPAGTARHMRYAFAYGANAVYAGQPRYSLRVRNNEFSRPELLAAAIEEAHASGRQFYLASNIAAHNDKVRTYLRDLAPIIEMRPDALIMSDPGLIMLVRETWPDQPVHLSVQANATNWATVQFWQRQGIERVILSRELSLAEIAEIKAKCPGMELEVFVHGALCIAYSGRCLLSGYMTHRDANQGACTNACRWQYNVHEAAESPTSGDLIAKVPADPAPQEQAVMLQEASRPGEYMPAYEDEHGTYIMNSKDLRAVAHVPEFVAMGIDSLKIEGRTKSVYYAARTAQVYRRAIDAAHRGQPFQMHWLGELDHLANRGYTEGFYRRHVPAEYQNYDAGASSSDARLVGDVLDVEPAQGRILVDVKNRFAIGDVIELMTPAGNLQFQPAAMASEQGAAISIAPGSDHRVWLSLPDDAEPQRLLTDANGFAMLVSHGAAR
jgi:U32 family peptidase